MAVSHSAAGYPPLGSPEHRRASELCGADFLLPDFLSLHPAAKYILLTWGSFSLSCQKINIYFKTKMIILFTTTGYRELERVSLTHKNNNNNNIKNMFLSTNYKA